MGLSATEGRSEDLPDSARSLFIRLANTVSIHGERRVIVLSGIPFVAYWQEVLLRQKLSFLSCYVTFKCPFE